MDSTVTVLARVLRFAAAVNSAAPPVDGALGPLRRLLDAAGVSHKLVGGVAVVHHGYLRTTEDIEVLVVANALDKLAPLCAAHGFEQIAHARLRHLATNVRVDLLVEGEAMPRAGTGVYPAPSALDASARDSAIVGLAGLVELKLRSGRHQDHADVVALLKLLDDVAYDRLESDVPTKQRPELLALRRDALEELTWSADERDP